MVPESKLEKTEHGLVPKGEGWFVLGLRDAVWRHADGNTSVAGLTENHLNMRWPSINEPHAPDRPGSRFRQPFGAVPILLGLGYPATA